MSDANMATSTKQLIISIVIVGVMLATANQIGQNFLLTSINARIDSVETRIDAVERNLNARIDSVEARIDAVERNLNARIDSVQSGLNARIDSLEKNFEGRFARIDGDIRELRRGQKVLNQGFSALTERVARIESSLFASAEKRARAEQAPLKSEADRVQIAP